MESNTWEAPAAVTRNYFTITKEFWHLADAVIGFLTAIYQMYNFFFFCFECKVDTGRARLDVRRSPH